MGFRRYIIINNPFFICVPDVVYATRSTFRIKYLEPSSGDVLPQNVSPMWLPSGQSFVCEMTELLRIVFYVPYYVSIEDA